MNLLKILGLGFGISITVGSAIGSGILRVPSDVATYLPYPLFFLGIWPLIGLYIILCLFPLAELGTMFPFTGGQYTYAKKALGPFAGFLVGWCDYLSTCGSVSAISLITAETFIHLFGLGASSTLVFRSSFVILFFVGLFQTRGLNWDQRSQNLLSFLKAVLFLSLGVACLVFGKEHIHFLPLNNLTQSLSFPSIYKNNLTSYCPIYQIKI